MLSYRSPFDRHEEDVERKDSTAISEGAKRGLLLFRSLECGSCHGGFNFSDSTRSTDDPSPPAAFHNTGQYNITGTDGSPGNYPRFNQGVFEISGNPADKGRMRAPDKVGDGANNPNKDSRAHSFSLSAAEKADLIEFLNSLTDTEFTTDPRLADPFTP